jgi:hypothetical protein
MIVHERQANAALAARVALVALVAARPTGG